MTAETKKYLVIGLIIVGLSVAGIMFYRSFFGGSGGGNTGDPQIALMCASCGGFEVSVDEFRKMMSHQGPGAMMMSGKASMECPKCSKKSCYQAQKCKQCETIFVVGQARDQNYPDRCPNCSFSRIEDRQNKPAP